MKKIFMAIVILSTIFITGCGKEDDEQKIEKIDPYEGKTGKVTCVMETKTQNFDFKGTYNLEYVDGYVTQTYAREVMTMKNKDAVGEYVEKLKEEYKKYDELEHYQYEINQSDNKVINNTLIYYQKIDLKELAKIANSQIVDKEDLKFSKVLASYKILGAKCEEE